ncbi:hypothetical protein A3A67_01690 [Candidatus Peribacteria bacterium RIFCSPLOWO2_01_FULL_51_18]|nr:MAG: hypothetical protein A3C52_03870 [Candidatus Peribacteria bacterium RIFCSPHIGHO2_02_FULL_51_15]OGJ65179.1 MAG: hypothetical protein A3A67_01690 [Candidatus Peribacteria bacterium RIFCSPLOWO2_01_FULL_51_18]OGJ67247.1 MAG: hypothetical protein A3J34_00930 [Candidatus Peribacteria bacterium RIFCSPLOWO2_02_FULL_51_10]
MPDIEAPFTVYIAQQQPSSQVLLSFIRRSAGPFMLVIPPKETDHLSDETLKRLFGDAQALNADRRLVIATKDKRVAQIAATFGWQVISTIKQLRIELKTHPLSAEAYRAFSPVSWRQDIRSRLQNVGLLSLPKLRIWLLFFLSVGAFLYVFFRLLPSAEIRIWPNQESQNFTTNIYLRASGAVLPVPGERVRVLPLKKLTVFIDRMVTYDQISKNFTGTNAKMNVLVTNATDEEYALKKGTRMVNQAGMRFRLQSDLFLPPHSKIEARVSADPIDQYGEVLGERGNVPAGIKWDFPGLSEKERTLVYARNEKPASGGKTSYVNQVTLEDVQGSALHPGARQRLEQELINVAKQQVEDERINLNNINGTHLVQLKYDELTKVFYKNFSLSESFIGQNVSSIPIQGSIEYTVILYDEDKLLDLLKDEIMQRVPSERVIVQNSLTKENMNINVISPWDDDLGWVKVTADLTYNQRYVLDPITSQGAKFGKYLRDSVAGKSSPEAYRIIKNFPEVSKVEISIWPPWAYSLPEIGTNIAVKEMENK